MNKVPVWALWALVGVVLLSGYALIDRYKAEASNRAVGISMEYSVIAELAAVSGVPVPVALERLKESGLTGVTLSEVTIDDLLRRGEISIREIGWAIHGVDRHMDGGSTMAQSLVREALTNRFPNIGAGDIEFATILSTPVGLDPVQAELVRAAGLDSIARLRSLTGLTESQIDSKFAEVSDLGCTFYLPEGDGVLGQAGAIDFSVEAMQRHGLVYLTPEFVRIVGDGSVKLKAPTNTVRLHSIQQAEVDRMSRAEIKERFVRAFRERNIRYMLIRLPVVSADAPLEEAMQMISGIRSGIVRYGGDTKTPRPFDESKPPLALLLAIAALSAVWMIGLVSVSVHSSLLRAIKFGFILLLAAACFTESGRQYFALLVALSAPIMAVVVSLSGSRSVIARYCVAVLICLACASAVPALLSGSEYMIQALAFKGVKVAHFLPVLVVGAMLLMRESDVRTIARSPVLWGTALAALGGLVLIALMLARTGNESPAAVPGIELRIRALLDQWLYVRPRSKELFAFPALFIGLALFNRAFAGGASNRLVGALGAVGITFGVIGLASMVNTLAHLHTPLIVSGYRIAIGVLLGGLGGLVLWPAVRSFFPSPGGSESE